ncbi:aldehyde dehydrogenase (acceptor) [Paraburkholderia rhizosphaerae]|uniref:Aldehyde dehydrogenase (Acceptor) n=1 Tax=Paraburkholderia rhizosphaerae TaxID=480658 RepID=A0A4V3HDV8_9BURK|nr:aldehyde dehydrogenase (acceptor) [Paraburkholderia rhizosphaerae]
MGTESDLQRHDLLIDGERVPPRSGEYSVDIDPASEQPIARVARGSAADVDTAVRAARAALPVWNGIRASERGRILVRFADLLRANEQQIAELESLDAGKPIASVLRQDLPATIDTLAYYAGWCDKINGEVVPVRPDALTYTVREPVGVVAAIVPWNFPLMIGMWKIAPALACGCTLIVKPAEVTPLSALRVAELALEAGVPPGVFNVVTGKGSVVGDALVAHPGIDKVTFTGSPSVGRGILQGAASNFKRVTLELGGKSANVIFPDANLDSAVRAAASGVFFNTGQVCSAGSRILAHRDVYDDVVERLAARAKSIKVGDPTERETGMGPLISASQMKTVLGYIDIGKNEGASLVTGGARIGERGFFVEPTCSPMSRTKCAFRRRRFSGRSRA